MAKSEKEKKVTKKASSNNSASKVEKSESKSSKMDNVDDDDDLDLDDDTPPKKSGKSSGDEDEDDVEVSDDWEKSEDDDNWDPDFNEFDLPKSKTKKRVAEPKKQQTMIFPSMMNSRTYTLMMLLVVGLMMKMISRQGASFSQLRLRKLQQLSFF
jgi:hypothetical protein